ncbi:MFS transporter [Vibrio sp. CAIM 722]|uniref:MFS transporter n=1 Tax=Vibrio eleionomae TaxID=2653505 RepID=A0A7X4LJF0_9VIBR|nr:MFS transporter [Vibrio eleionomae]MZI93060.1 MFS transporter [Vibrio eleionomae]
MTKLGNLGAFALMAVACLTIMVGCVIVPGLPDIANQLHLSPQQSSWLVTLPSLGVVIFGAPVGRVMKRLGAYSVLIIGLVLYGALGIIGMWIENTVVLFADRLVLGGATAMVMASGTALISDFYQGSQRLKMIALQGMSIELGGVIFLAIGGILAKMHWSFPFYLYLMAWVFLILVVFFVPKPRLSHHGMTNSSIKPEETTGKEQVRIVYFAACLSMILFFTAVIMMPRFLSTLGLNESQTGYFMAFISLIAVGAASQMPKVQHKLGSISTLSLAFIAYALSHALYSSGSLPIMIVGAIVMGIGFGLSVPLVNHMIVERSYASHRNQNLAMLSVAIFLGQFLSSFMSYIPGNGRDTFLVAGIAALIIALLFLTQRKSDHVEQPKIS